MKSALKKYFDTPAEAAPLAAFRIFFGLMMLGSIVRFWANGWIEKLYLEPDFHFTYLGFEWVQPLGTYTYVLFAICALSAVGVALGFWYRLSATVFFASFTYIELMDKTTYLNHYYFISVLGFLLIFLPAQRYFSVDAWRKPEMAARQVPRWSIDSIKILLTIVYFYAGLAKLNSDWLLEAQPLATWLPGRYDIPVLGHFLNESWLHYAFSWGGALYDLSIPFLLFYKPTRKWAFILVVVFHLLTRILFPIGMFPYIMIVSALIFFDSTLHHSLLKKISSWFGINKAYFDQFQYNQAKWRFSRYLKLTVLALLFGLQILLPWRYMLYPGELFWHEQGFRFSWRVMLMEKAGYTSFSIYDPLLNETFTVDNQKHLTAFQEKQMSFQPDFILEYAHFLEDYYQKDRAGRDLQVYVESYVALNGRASQPYISPNVDLTQQQRSWKPKNWILPFNERIYGL